MALVLEALASYIQNMLLEMTKEEVHLLLGVPNEIKKMDKRLGDLKRFLTDADKRKISDESVQTWVKELRNAMYDATNILDLCQLKAIEHGPSWDMGCFNPLLFCMRNPLHAHDIGNRIKKLNERLDDIDKSSKAFNFVKLASYVDGGRLKAESSHCARRETTGEDELCAVGEKIEEDTRNLVELLTRKEKTIHNKILVFAIVGVGGIGKTTLAKKIFNNDIINEEFQKRIWLSVNQEFSDINLLERAITEARGDHQAARNTKAALERTLKYALEGCKTLLVLDDVWNHEIWEKVLEPPLINSLAEGSRVLVTTRHDTVARGMRAVVPYHQVTKLEQEDAWSLLKKQVVPNGNNDEPKIDTLKDIGMGLIGKCDGLPLAIKIMGGLLRQKKARRSDWKSVLKDSIWSVQMPRELNYAIYLSYQDLHPNLKPCFLHYALLPKGTVFWETLVVAMWIGEGFIHGNSDDLEVLGKEYYYQLIARNLIEPDLRYMDQAVCNMHDVVRSFAQYVARDEALTISHKSEGSLTDKLGSPNVIRLSLKTKESDSNKLEWNSLQAHMSLRTLILVGHIKINPCDSLSFSCLRILHVQDGNFDALGESLVKLKHLRYLSIGGTDTSRLPEKIAKMKLLQCISLYNCKNLLKLPCGVGKLQQLRVLVLNGTGINSTPKGFDGLTNLRKLYGFPAHVDDYSCSLEELGPLSHLIELSISGLKKVSFPSFATKARLGEKVCLSYLSLNCTSRQGDDHCWLVKEEEQQQIVKVFDELCPPPCLEHLVIKGYFGQQLPNWMTLTAAAPLGSLRILMIKHLPYCQELSDGLFQLPDLEFLQIERAPDIKRIGPEFLLQQHPEHTSTRENLGSDLKIKVIRCRGLERISHLPKLQNLEIHLCPKLKLLEGLPTLQRLWIEDYDMETLPRYLQDVNTRILELDCNISLLASIAKGKSSPEWNKFIHIKQMKAYAKDDENNIKRKWYVRYTSNPSTLKTNVIPPLSANTSGVEVEEVSGEVMEQ